MIKVILTGSHSTGKTTVVEKLKKEDFFQKSSFDFFGEVFRGLLKKGFKLNKQSNLETQLFGFNKYSEALIETTNRVFDRSLIDVLAYTNYLVNKKGSLSLKFLMALEQLSVEILDELILRGGDSLFIFYFKPMFFIKDGVRDEDKKYQQEIDKLISFYMNFFDERYFLNLNYHSEEIKVKDLNERVKFILKKLS